MTDVNAADGADAADDGDAADGADAADGEAADERDAAAGGDAATGGVRRGWAGVGAVAGWQLVASVAYYATFAATAGMRETLGISRFAVGVVVATLTLGYTASLFPAGALVDGFGDKPVMVGGLVGLAAGAVGVAASPSFAVLLVTVFVLGAAYASAMPATNRAVADRAPRGRYNLAVGLKQVGVTAGSAVAALLVTGLAAAGRSWRAGFLVAAAAAAVVAVGFAVAYRGGGRDGTLSVPDVTALAGDRALRRLAVGGFFLGAALFTATGYLVPYLDEGVGVSIGLAGTTLALMQVAGSAGRVGAGALADRLPGDAAVASTAVLLGQAAVAAALLLALPGVGRPAVFPLVAVLGVALLGGTGLYHGALVVLAPADRSGAATAAGQTAINLGGLAVPPLFGWVADAAGYAPGWRLLGACMAACAVAVFLARRAAAVR